jgi:glycosyltransferase involved in cell wall biosynthesis
MKVLILSTSDIAGGAARAAYRLHKALQGIGVESEMLVLEKLGDDYSVIGPKTKLKRFINWIYNRIDTVLLRFYKLKVMYSASLIPGDISKKIDEINPDIVHMHWINGGFVDIDSLHKIKQPVVWSLHDMWAFTGGCHYDQACGKYVSNCGTCPILDSTRERDLSRWVYNRKAKVYPKVKSFTIVPVSNWMGDLARKSSLLGQKRIEVIPNAIDTTIFKPVEKRIARQLLNLPENKRLVMFGNLDGADDPRKGLTYLLKALEMITSEQVDLVVFGASRPKEDRKIGNYDIHYMGKLNDNVALSVLYAAADVLIVPSLQENLSNTIMESLACGTPVVGFDIGGNADMIDHKVNGYLAQALNTEDLARGIDWVIQNTASSDLLFRNARQKVMDCFAADTVARKHVALYRKLLSELHPTSHLTKTQHSPVISE